MSAFGRGLIIAAFLFALAASGAASAVTAQFDIPQPPTPRTPRPPRFGTAQTSKDVRVERGRIYVDNYVIEPEFLDTTPTAGSENGVKIEVTDAQGNPVGETAEGLKVEVACEGQASSGPLALTKAANEVNEYRSVPFTPLNEGNCTFHVTGTFKGKTVDARITHYVEEAGATFDADDGGGLPLIPLTAGAAGLAAAAAGVVIRRRKSRPSVDASSRLPKSFGGGRYELKQFLGEGGMKRVYLVHDTRLGRDVALALIKSDALDARSLERVRREAQAMARLGDHPNIVSIHDTGDESGRPYLVCQYLEGGSLHDSLESREYAPFPTKDVLRIGIEICKALEYAHARGVVHRDLKPENVWLTSDGRVKLGDFGLAVAIGRSRLTTEGSMVGTVAYMPPEQAEGKSADARSDLYSLGAILFELLTGRPPFEGEGAASVIAQHLNSPPRPPSALNKRVSKPLDKLVLALLAKDPAQRPASADDVRSSLESLARRTPDRAEALSAIDAVEASIEQRRPDLSVHAAGDGTVTLMFTDIESSTPLADRLGDRKWLELLRSHDELIRGHVSEHRGTVVDTAGDGYFVAFPSAREGVRCAIGIQRSLAAERRRDAAVKVRIGLHTGEAIRDAKKFYGIHVHLAARVGAQAQGGEIVISQSTKELLEGDKDFKVGEAREVELKGISGSRHIFPVTWRPRAKSRSR